MDKEKGFRYLVEGKEDLGDFAKGILALANLRSSELGVVDFSTHAGSQLVTIISYIENDSYINSHVGKVIEKEEISINVLTYEGLSRESQKEVEQLDELYFSNGNNYHIVADLVEGY